MQEPDNREPDSREPGDQAASRPPRKRRNSGSRHPALTGVRGLFRTAANGALACLHLALGLAAWGLRMLWNACWLCFAGVCICFGLCFLFGLGMLVVLWMQHYPLAGVTIGCLGLVLCAFSAALFSLTLLRWKKRGARISNEETEGEQCV